MLTNALAVGALTLLAGLLGAAALRALPSVRLQLAGLALVAVALPTVAIVLSGSVVLHMGAEGELIAVAVAAAVASVVGALLVARGIAHRLEVVRRTSARLAAGELSERAPVSGPLELAELAATFNTMADHVEAILGARRELVAWASHDLRAPLASLRAVLEAIEDGVVEAGDYLPTLQGHVLALSALVEELFELACLDTGAEVLRPSPVDLAELAEESARRFAIEAGARGVELRVVARDQPAVALADRVALGRVLSNLVDNALRYTPDGGSIALGVGPGPEPGPGSQGAKSSVLLSVEDTGAGIPPDSLERVFEPFFRADAARETNGSRGGLGLAIARGLVEAQGGRIWAEQPLGGGSRLCVALPAVAGVVPGDGVAAPLSGAPPPAGGPDPD